MGMFSDLLEDVFTDRKEAEDHFDDLVLFGGIICKELWVKLPDGERKMLKTERKGETKNHG